MRRALSVLCLLCACAPEADTPPPTADEVAARLGGQGAYGVGWTTVDVTWQPPGADAPRTIPVEVWYPSDDVSRSPAATYRVAGVAEVPAPHAHRDAPPSSDGPFPVAAYSHGSGGIGMLAYPYAERMASHGWVVVAPDHLGNTSLDLLTGADPFGVIALHRPLDIAAALDGAAEGYDGALPGLADTARVHLFGHSFGGWTTLATAGAAVDVDAFSGACAPGSTDPTCQRFALPEVRAAFDGGFADARIAAIGPQAPAIVRGFVDGALAGLDQPALLQSGRLDITTTHAREAEPTWEGLDDPRDRWLDLQRGAHYTFISICDDLGIETIEVFQRGATEDGCGPDFTPTTEAIPALATWQLAFAERHVRDDTTVDVFLDRDEAGVSDTVVVQGP